MSKAGTKINDIPVLPFQHFRCGKKGQVSLVLQSLQRSSLGNICPRSLLSDNKAFR
jgi:hypothetical protein